MNRNPETAECWNCNKLYSNVFKNDDGQIIGHCDSCESDHVIVSAPPMKLEADLRLDI